MNKSDILTHVIDAVTKVQEASGRAVGHIGSDTRPLQDVDGFDSYSGVEASLFLSDSVGHEIPDSVFVPEKGRRLLSMNEIADNVQEQMSSRRQGK